MSDSIRDAMLRQQEQNLLRLAERSKLIRVTTVDALPGWPVERYFINYLCRSIVAITDEGAPIYGNAHQMELYLTADYPLAEPKLKFLTPIWHPNISSQAPRDVCTDSVNSWWAGKDLDELVYYVGELLQYRHYHAKWEPPFPKDRTVAEWVLTYAEPRGLVGSDCPTDRRPLRNPLRIYQGTVAAPAQARIQLGVRPATTLTGKRIALGLARA